MACPVNSYGTNVPSGCLCKSGFLGSVTATTVSPFFTSTCALDPSLRMWYLFAGTTTNTGAGAYTLTTTGSVSYVSTTVKAGQPSTLCIYFNNPNRLAMSANYLIAVAAAPFSLPMSATVWLNGDFNTYATALGLRGTGPLTSGPYSFQLDVTSTYVPLWAVALPSLWTVVQPAASNIVGRYSWFHTTVTVTSSYVCTMYVNGVQVATATGTAPMPANSFAQLVIGAPGDNSRSYLGYMYDLRMYSKVLTQAEIDAVYNFT